VKENFLLANGVGVMLKDKHINCSRWKQCCPGGTGSGNGIKCGKADCIGTKCKGTWMIKNCPNTCFKATGKKIPKKNT